MTEETVGWEAKPIRKTMKGWLHRTCMIVFKRLGYQSFTVADAKKFGAYAKRRLIREEEIEDVSYDFPVLIEEDWYRRAYDMGTLERKLTPSKRREYIYRFSERAVEEQSFE